MTNNTFAKVKNPATLRSKIVNYDAEIGAIETRVNGGAELSPNEYKHYEGLRDVRAQAELRLNELVPADDESTGDDEAETETDEAEGSLVRARKQEPPRRPPLKTKERKQDPSELEQRALAFFESAVSGAKPDEGERWRSIDSGEQLSIRSNESISSSEVFSRAAAKDASAVSHAEANYGSLGGMIRALATGSGGGSAIVPTMWSGTLIDLARNKAAVTQAGATTIAMEANTVKIGRRTADPSVAFRAENSAITPSDPSFDSVTLTAKTIAGIVAMSLEWWMDVEQSDSIITDALAKSIAQQIDLVALYGGITSGAGTINLPSPNPNPRGILAALAADLPGNVLGAATNGTTQAMPGAGSNFWAEVLQTVYKVKRGNEEPNALIWNDALAQQYATAVDTTGQPLRVPPALQNVQQLSTNRIPSYTQGTMTTASDLFVGDFSELLIGTRLSIRLQPLGELYAANGQFGVMAYARLDIAPARPTAFSVFRALKAAA